MASVIITSGEKQGEFLPLGRRINVIGRAENLPLQVLDDLVSRKHLRIKYEESTGRYLAEDMDSRNGVFVNNGKIMGETTLRDGDVIMIGTTSLLFTEKNFDDKDSALLHYKKVGERMKMTQYQPPTSLESEADQANKK